MIHYIFNNNDLTTARGKLSLFVIGTGIVGFLASTASFIYVLAEVDDPITLARSGGVIVAGYLTSFATASTGLFCLKKFSSSSGGDSPTPSSDDIESSESLLSNQ